VNLLRFQYLTATSMKIISFWDVASCSLVEIGRGFRGAYCLRHRSALMIKAVSTSETSVNFY
jgi:hypothetical protein